MTDLIREPARKPCASCPYRRDVPSGVWAADEYTKLRGYDRETFDQPPGVFLCHQQDGRVCAGWVGCHDMGESLAVRLGAAVGVLAPEVVDALYEYETPVPLWSSGAEAAAHGLASVRAPGPTARRVVEKIERRRTALPRGGTR